VETVGEGWTEWPGVIARVIEEVRSLVEELPPEGDRRLMELWQDGVMANGTEGVWLA